MMKTDFTQSRQVPQRRKVHSVNVFTLRFFAPSRETQY